MELTVHKMVKFRHIKIQKQEWLNGYQIRVIRGGCSGYRVYRHLYRERSPAYAKSVVSKFF